MGLEIIKREGGAYTCIVHEDDGTKWRREFADVEALMDFIELRRRLHGWSD